MGYIIVAQQKSDTLKYYYHGNNRDGKPRFNWNIISIGTTYYLRVYKSKKTAERIAKQVQAKVKYYQVFVEEI